MTLDLWEKNNMKQEQDKKLHKIIKKALLGDFENDPAKLERMIKKVKNKQKTQRK